MSTTNTPLAQLAKMYELVEHALRGHKYTIYSLNQVPDIAALVRSPYQVRDLVRTLVDKGHVAKEGTGKNTTYTWILTSAPFVLRTKLAQKAAKLPSEPTVTTITKNKERIVTPAREVELVIGGALIILGRNMATGRLRITIDDATI